MSRLTFFHRERFLTRAATLKDQGRAAMLSLRDVPNVVDILTIGLVAGIELASRDREPGTRAYDVFDDCFERGFLVRVTGNIIAPSPPLIISPEKIGDLGTGLRESLIRIG